jgi:hypothetical protein
VMFYRFQLGVDTSFKNKYNRHKSTETYEKKN